jgi:hypothetical protein
MGLTLKKIARLLQRPGRYRDDRCLYLQVASGGSASWLFRFQLAGRARAMGLGAWPLVSLEEARDEARAARKALRAGDDPLALKQADKAARVAARLRTVTFEAAARDYYKDNKTRWKNPKVSRQFLASLEAYVFPIIGAVSVAVIDVR